MILIRGGPNFLEVEHWLKEIKIILSFASCMLRDEADSWWEMIKSTHDVAQMKWTKFEEFLLANYFLEVIRRQKIVEFVQLLQKKMTITKYAAKFTQLSKYAQHMVADDQMRDEHFQEGLRLNIREQVAPFMLHTYSEVMTRA